MSDVDLLHGCGCTSYSFLGRGQYGNVYVVVMQDGHIRAAKIVTDPEAANREFRTAETLTLDCKHRRFFVTAHECFKAPKNQSTVFMLDYADRGDLTKFMTPYENVGICESMVMKLLFMNARALTEIHSQFFIHRDIKPDNILLSYDPETTTVRTVISDYGLLKKIGSTTQDAPLLQGTVCGTPLYMSPEAIAEDGYSQKMDVWSLGCIFYELLTGRHPFDSTSLLGIIRAHSRPLQPIANVSEACNDLLSKMLSFNATERISTFNNALLSHPFFFPLFNIATDHQPSDPVDVNSAPFRRFLTNPPFDTVELTWSEYEALQNKLLPAGTIYQPTRLQLPPGMERKSQLIPDMNETIMNVPVNVKGGNISDLAKRGPARSPTTASLPPGALFQEKQTPYANSPLAATQPAQPVLLQSSIVQPVLLQSSIVQQQDAHPTLLTNQPQPTPPETDLVLRSNTRLATNAPSDLPLNHSNGEGETLAALSQTINNPSTNKFAQPRTRKDADSFVADGSMNDADSQPQPSPPRPNTLTPTPIAPTPVAPTPSIPQVLSESAISSTLSTGRSKWARTTTKQTSVKLACQICGIQIKTEEMQQHMEDKHPAEMDEQRRATQQILDEQRWTTQQKTLDKLKGEYGCPFCKTGMLESYSFPNLIFHWANKCSFSRVDNSGSFTCPFCQAHQWGHDEIFSHIHNQHSGDIKILFDRYRTTKMKNRFSEEELQLQSTASFFLLRSINRMLSPAAEQLYKQSMRGFNFFFCVECAMFVCNSDVPNHFFRHHRATLLNLMLPCTFCNEQLFYKNLYQHWAHSCRGICDTLSRQFEEAQRNPTVTCRLCSAQVKTDEFMLHLSDVEYRHLPMRCEDGTLNINHFSPIVDIFASTAKTLRHKLENESFFCPFCSAQMLRADAIAHFVSSCPFSLRPNERQPKCPLCRYAATTPMEMWEHIKIAHRPSLQDGLRETRLSVSCRLCSTVVPRADLAKHYMSNHSSVHHDQRSLNTLCPVCQVIIKCSELADHLGHHKLKQ
ncbi:putative serine/threonine protein kinase [Blattamonas nauphoetae]|uniref:Serine/threonine protein kinase n=1 Tax=Blattamonas nauphoetae TaxID=2049346 RepID=A0ABQ9YIC0_9EUKA|nr:putative serine/threonine protein kinase [Blattamonas nauphoetae]